MGNFNVQKKYKSNTIIKENETNKKQMKMINNEGLDEKYTKKLFKKKR